MFRLLMVYCWIEEWRRRREREDEGRDDVREFLHGPIF
jgi:hypothetical protein